MTSRSATEIGGARATRRGPHAGKERLKESRIFAPFRKRPPALIGLPRKRLPESARTLRAPTRGLRPSRRPCRSVGGPQAPSPKKGRHATDAINAREAWAASRGQAVDGGAMVRGRELDAEKGATGVAGGNEGRAGAGSATQRCDCDCCTIATMASLATDAANKRCQFESAALRAVYLDDPRITRVGPFGSLASAMIRAPLPPGDHCAQRRLRLRRYRMRDLFRACPHGGDPVA